MGSGRGAEHSSREWRRFGGERGAGLREQGVLGECGTMTQACRETPGGAGGVANDDPALGVQRGGAPSGPAEGPWRVREGGAPPVRCVSAAGVRGRQPPANDSWNADPKGRSASWLVSMGLAKKWGVEQRGVADIQGWRAIGC